jgi:hypothetical protein
MTTFDKTVGSPPFMNTVMSMEQWRHYVEGYDFGSIWPDKVVLHHSVEPTLASWAGLKTMKGMQNYYHTSAPGAPWSAGPHIFAAPDGIWFATPMSMVGVHARWCNETRNAQNKLIGYSLGVEMVGNYTNSRPTGIVWEETLTILGELCMRLDKKPRDLITFHRYCGKPECPGNAVQDEWVWASVEAWLENTHGTPYGAWRVISENAVIHQGPSEEFPPAGRVSFNEIILVDTETDDYVHMADLNPLQFDEGFIRKSGQLRRL